MQPHEELQHIMDRLKMFAESTYDDDLHTHLADACSSLEDAIPLQETQDKEGQPPLGDCAADILYAEKQEGSGVRA